VGAAQGGEELAVPGGERVGAAGALEVGERLQRHVDRVDGEGGEGEVGARLPAGGLVHRKEQDQGQAGVTGPARERDQVGDLAEPPARGRSNGEERDEATCLAHVNVRVQPIATSDKRESVTPPE